MRRNGERKFIRVRANSIRRLFAALEFWCVARVFLLLLLPLLLLFFFFFFCFCFSKPLVFRSRHAARLMNRRIFFLFSSLSHSASYYGIFSTMHSESSEPLPLSSTFCLIFPFEQLLPLIERKETRGTRICRQKYIVAKNAVVFFILRSFLQTNNRTELDWTIDWLLHGISLRSSRSCGGSRGVLPDLFIVVIVIHSIGSSRQLGTSVLLIDVDFRAFSLL